MKKILTIIAIIYIVAFGGCVVPELNKEGRACPCTEGYKCIDSVCVVDGATTRDAGSDSSNDQ